VQQSTAASSDSSLPPAGIEALRARLRTRGLVICLSGIDGSGKTTLANQLVVAFKRAGLPARHLHVYQWHMNLMAMPVRLLFNRHIGREVLVLDRTLFDNLAVLALRCPRWMLRGLLRLALAVHPRFDYCFYLVADFAETLRRRPETTAPRYEALRADYDWVTSMAGHTRLNSDTALFGEVMRRIAGRAADDTSFSMERR